MSELKPCPFCGSEPIEMNQTGDKRYWATCRGCGADQPLSDSEPEAVAAWNCRAEDRDAQRLDYLDARNARKNVANGTTYGWQLTENHNRIALEDHGWPARSVRECIDAAIDAERAAKGADSEGGEA